MAYLNNLKITVNGHIVEVLHKNGKHITFSIDCPPGQVKKLLREFPLKDRLAYFDEHGTTEGF